MLLRLEEFCSLTDMVSVCPGWCGFRPRPDSRSFLEFSGEAILVVNWHPEGMRAAARTVSHAVSPHQASEAAILVMPIPPHGSYSTEEPEVGRQVALSGTDAGSRSAGMLRLYLTFLALRGPPGKHGDSQEMASGLQGLGGASCPGCSPRQGWASRAFSDPVAASAFAPCWFCCIKPSWLGGEEDGRWCLRPRRQGLHYTLRKTVL